MLKKFKEVFQSLECSNYIDELLNFVFVEKVSASSDMSLIRIHIIAERIIDKKIIFELETLIKEKMFSKKNIKIKIFEKFNLSTQYTAQNLYEIYKDSILLEIKNYKIAQYLILNNAPVEFEGNTMVMTVEKNPVNDNVIGDLVRILEKIFNERCGILCTVNTKFVKAKEKEAVTEFAERINVKKTKSDKFMSENNSEHIWEGNADKSAENKKGTGEKSFAGNRGKNSENNKFTKKKFTYQKSTNPDVIYGRDFEDNFISISDLVGEIGEVAVRGKITEVDSRYLERSDSTLYIFAITDFTDSVNVKMFIKSEQLETVKPVIVKGNYLKIDGLALIDKFNSELTISSVKGIKKCEKFEENVREDNEPIKRVELHCHTKMSDFDGVSSAAEIINQAKSWGMDAIAITDHGKIGRAHV